MTTTIAIAGKGGSGKTPISALLIELLSQKGAVLAIDADPATNLNLALGLPLNDTVGKVREQMAKAGKERTLEPGGAKQDYLDIMLLVSDLSVRGILTAANMKSLMKELRTYVEKVHLIVNRGTEPLPPKIAKAIEESSLKVIGVIPEDSKVSALDAAG